MSSYCEDLCYKIDNPAYALRSFCLKGYSHYQSNNEVVFDAMVWAAQNLIEWEFGLIKARWAILTRKINLKLDSVPLVKYVSFIFTIFVNWKM